MHTTTHLCAVIRRRQLKQGHGGVLIGTDWNGQVWQDADIIVSEHTIGVKYAACTIVPAQAQNLFKVLRILSGMAIEV